MIPYIICFIAVAIFSYFAERSLGNKRRTKYIIYSLIAVLIPSVMAGCRDYDIGADIGVYVLPTFNQALRYSNLIDFLVFNSTWYKSVDILFAILSFFVSRFTTNCHWMLFAIALICNTCFYLGWVKLRRFVPVWLGMLLYLFMYYNQSYNHMRQMLAASILFFALQFIFEEKYIHYIICVILAIMFHSSAIMGFAILFLYMVIGRENSNL